MILEKKQSFAEKLVSCAFSNYVIFFLVILITSVMGTMSFFSMSRNVYPDMTIPIFTIVTENEVMAPEEIETSVTIPIESAMNGLPGVRRVRSQTSQGLSSVVVEFDISCDFWRSRQFVSEKLSQISSSLPAGTEAPNMSSATTRLAEVCEYGLESSSASLEKMREIADWEIRTRLMMVPGVSEVLNMGGKMKQFRVFVDMDALAARNIPLSAVESGLKEGNENASGGFISTGTAEYNVRAIGRFTSAEDMKKIIIAHRKGVPVYLEDVADIEDSFAIRRGIVSIDGRESVAAIVIKQPDADTVKVMDGVRKVFDEIRKTLPEGITLSLYYDQTVLINNSLRNVAESIVIGAFLVVGVLWFFMGRIRTTIVVACSIPVAVMMSGNILLGFKTGINTMSLGGLAIAVGIMVDSSIIMVENIFHRFSQKAGKLETLGDRIRTAEEAACEMAPSVTGAAIIIVAVFLPLFIMEGIEGLMFRPLAITVASAMMCSLFLSLCFTPVLSALFLNFKGGASGEVKAVTAIKKLYAPVLDMVIRNRMAVSVAVIVIMVASFFLLLIPGRDFMPKMDEGAWVISTAASPETSLEENDRITSMIEQILMSNPNVEKVIRRNGRSERAIGCVLPVNSGEIIVNLVPRGRRTASVDVIKKEVRDRIEKIPGVAVAFTQPLQLKIDESMEGTPAPLQVKIFGNDPAELQSEGVKLRNIMRETEGLADVNLNQAAGIPQLQIRIDREAAASYGISVGNISEVIRLAAGGEEVTRVWVDQRSYGVFVRAKEEQRNDAEAIGRLLIDAPDGRKIPLSQVADIELTEGPNVIWREAMSRMTNINASIEKGSLSGIVSEIAEKIRDAGIAKNFRVVFAGQYENQQRAMKALGYASVLALIAVFAIIYLVLGTLSESLIILLTAPSALIGGIISLLLFGETINVSSGVGFIAVFGIAIENSLVLFSQTREFLEKGYEKNEAIKLASTDRLRPKLMTVLCTVLALIPILFANSAGSEIEKPLAIVLTGGLATSTLFTLLILPAFYMAVEDLKNKRRAK